MEIIRGRENGNVYTVSFWLSLGWMFFGPVVFIFTLLIILFIRDPNLFDDLSFVESNEFVIQSLFLQYLANILAIALILVVFRRVLIKQLKLFKENLAIYIGLIALGFFLIYISNIITYQIFGELESDNQIIIETAMSSSMLPVMFISVVIIAPFIEEMIFRKFLFGALIEKARMNIWLVGLISAVIFAGVHVIGNWEFFFQYFILSVIITLSYILSKRNIYVPITLHFINNLLAFIVMTSDII